MSSKRERQLAKARARRELRVRCDACDFRQPFSVGNGSRHANGELDVAGCLRCGGHYGTWV